MKKILLSFLTIIGCFMTVSCSSSKEKKCECSGKCYTEEMPQKEDNCSCPGK